MTNLGDGLGAAVVGAAVGGDRPAAECLLAWVQPFAVRYCRARLGRQEGSFASADDVAQEVCLAVLTALPGHRHQGRPFVAFVYGIAAQKVAARSDRVARTPGTDTRPEQPAAQGGLPARMASLLGSLPARHREILVLRVAVGLSADDTADAMGTTPGAVRILQHHALAMLRRALAAEEVV
ncbi:MAG TPA: sigma-70 family RNA polymerase sigma factor [Pseudonocardiaceae bacterium]|nr:sigma-70 family RNA polymerase sigma factor [Pseudonocardiaceae bacterium]